MYSQWPIFTGPHAEQSTRVDTHHSETSRHESSGKNLITIYTWNMESSLLPGLLCREQQAIGSLIKHASVSFLLNFCSVLYFANVSFRTMYAKRANVLWNFCILIHTHAYFMIFISVPHLKLVHVICLPWNESLVLVHGKHLIVSSVCCSF